MLTTLLLFQVNSFDRLKFPAILTFTLFIHWPKVNTKRNSNNFTFVAYDKFGIARSPDLISTLRTAPEEQLLIDISTPSLPLENSS